MKWSNCGIAYHVCISRDSGENGGFQVRVSDEAFDHAPYLAIAQTRKEAMQIAVEFVFPATKQPLGDAPQCLNLIAPSGENQNRVA